MHDIQVTRSKIQYNQLMKQTRNKINDEKAAINHSTAKIFRTKSETIHALQKSGTKIQILIQGRFGYHQLIQQDFGLKFSSLDDVTH